MSAELAAELELATDAARRAGAIQLERYERLERIVHKGPGCSRRRGGGAGLDRRSPRRDRELRQRDPRLLRQHRPRRRGPAGAGRRLRSGARRAVQRRDGARRHARRPAHPPPRQGAALRLRHLPRPALARLAPPGGGAPARHARQPGAGLLGPFVGLRGERPFRRLRPGALALELGRRRGRPHRRGGRRRGERHEGRPMVRPGAPEPRPLGGRRLAPPPPHSPGPAAMIAQRRRRGGVGGGLGPRPLAILVGILLAIIAAGTLGYVVLEGWGPGDALYMTVITLTTVGFREVAELDGAGRAWTMLLALSAVGIIFGTVGIAAEYVVEEVTSGRREEKRMRERIAALSGHFVLCGNEPGA